MEELHAMNEDLTQSQQDGLDTQRRYRELFEGVPEAYFVTDLHGFIQEANRTAAQLLHIDRSQLVGFPLIASIAKEMRASFRCSRPTASPEAGPSHIRGRLHTCGVADGHSLRVADP